MNKRKLNKVFSEIKEKANMDYAITNPMNTAIVMLV